MNYKDIEQIEGWLRPNEIELLVEKASIIQNGVIVEIGSYRGRSSNALAIGSKLNKFKNKTPVYCIEPHEDFIGEYGGIYGSNDRKAFYENTLRLGNTDIIRLINLPSDNVVKAWNMQIGLLFIDGDHSYVQVKRDLFSWTKFVCNGGYVLCHDSNDPSSNSSKAIREFLHKNKRFNIEKIIESITTLKCSYD